MSYYADGHIKVIFKDHPQSFSPLMDRAKDRMLLFKITCTANQPMAGLGN
jgi:hypothetical protein